MLLRCLSIITVVIACQCAFSQQPIEPNATKTCTFSEIYQEKGWTVPGAPAVDIKDARKPLIASMPGVFVTKMTPATAETMITRIRCSRDQGGRLEVNEEPIGIIWLVSF